MILRRSGGRGRVLAAWLCCGLGWTVVPSATAAPDPSATAEHRRVPRPVAEQLAQAAEALQQREFERAATLFRALIDGTDLDLTEPRVGYALAQIALGEDALALSVVLDGLARAPRQPLLLELLGDLRNREERVPDALRSWKEAFAVAPNDRLREKILKAERELHAGRDYELEMSSHFNLRYDGQADPALAGEVVEFLEQGFWEMADRFDHTPRQPITVVLYPGRQFRDVTRSPEWVGGLYDGKIRVPLGGLKRLNPVAGRLLLHELTHAFVHSKSRGHCPRWLHEGLAQRMEGRELSRRDRLGVLERLRGIEPSAWDAEGFSYPLALSLTTYLEQRSGFGRLIEVLERLGKGDDDESALRDVYGAGYATLCRDWAATVLDEGIR